MAASMKWPGGQVPPNVLLHHAPLGNSILKCNLLVKTDADAPAISEVMAEGMEKDACWEDEYKKWEVGRKNFGEWL